MRLSSAVLCVLLCGMFAPSLVADTKTHEASGVEIWIPDNWKCEEVEESLVCGDPDDEVALFFIVLPYGTLEAACDALDEECAKIIDNLETDDGEEVELNGMRGYLVEGNGTVEGQRVEASVLALDVPKQDCVLLAFGMGVEGAAERHEETLAKILESIRAKE